jgi:hypothetical protein
MAKIIAGSGPSYPEGHAPGDGEEHVHPGYGVPMEGTEHPADGTLSPSVSNDDGEAYHVDSGDPGIHAEGIEVLKVPAEGASAEPAATLPRTPPRRPPGVTGAGGITLPKPGATSGE